MFWHWLREEHPQPYGSFGNGSTMRVSAVGWRYDDLETTRRMAALTASVTHNHPEAKRRLPEGAGGKERHGAL